MQAHRSHWKQVAALAVGLTCGASAVQAQGALVTQGTVIAHSVATGGLGDVVNGLGGEVYGGSSGMQSGLIDENGVVTFIAQMQGGAATNTANDKGIFRGSTRANVTLVLRSSDPAPGLPGLFLRNAASSAGLSTTELVSANGQVLFQSNLQDAGNTVPTTADSALMGGVVGSFGVWAREGDAAAGTVGATLGALTTSQQSSGINRNGRVLFQAATLGGDTVTTPISNALGWWTGPQGGPLELVVRRGDSIPGTPGDTLISAFGFVSQMNPSGQVVHSQTLSTTLGAVPATNFDNTVLLLYTPGSPGTTVKIVREGDPAPGTVGATFNAVSGTGTPLVMGQSWSVDGGTTAFNASGQYGAWWSLFNGDTVAPVTSNGYGNDAALYRASASGITKIFRKGDVAPGTGGACWNFVSTSNVLMNNSGKFAVQGAVFDTLVPSAVPPVTTANDTGVWAGDEFGMTLIMREGDVAPFVTGGGTIGGMTGIQPFHFNDLGQVLFQAPIVGNTSVPAVTAALYSWDPVLGLTLQLTNQDAIEVQPTVFKTAFTWGGIQFNNGDDGAFCFNHSGKFVMRLSYSPTGQTLITGQIQHGTPRNSYCFGDGTDTTCPCSNAGLAGRGCDNTSASGGAQLTCSGTASILNDTLVLNGTFANPFGPGLYYQGSTTANPTAPFGIAFGNGLRCAGGVTPRLEIVNPADALGASNTTVQIHTLGGITLPGTYYYQLWYRDSPNFGSCTSGFNFSNGISLAWTP